MPRSVLTSERTSVSYGSGIAHEHTEARRVLAGSPGLAFSCETSVPARRRNSLPRNVFPSPVPDEGRFLPAQQARPLAGSFSWRTSP